MKMWESILLSPEGDGGGASGNGDQANLEGNDAQGGAEGGKEGDDDEGGDGEGGDDDAGKAKTATGLTKDDITDILSRVMPSGGERETKQLDRQYTQDEIDKMLNVWKPDAGFLRKMGFAEPTAEQLSAIHELRDNLIRQANTMSEARIQQLFSERQKEIDEVRGYISEQRAQAATNAFFAKNPELKPYEEIVDAVSAKLDASGFKAPSQDKVFEEIARNTTEVLKRMNVKVEKKGGKPAGSRMAQLAGGGQGGGEAGGKGGGKRKVGMEIFDETD
jgi:hypothetical protein